MNRNAPRILSRTPLTQGRFIELEAIVWKGADGIERIWETAERVGRREAVMMIARLVPSNRLVLIRQYRPPIDRFVIEFPAGIMDLEGESPEVAAQRELVEETGYHGEVTTLTPPTFNTPGLTSESVYQVSLEIDETRTENQNPQPVPDGEENIEVLTIPFTELGAFLRDGLKRGEHFDSKVVAFIHGSQFHEC